MTGPYDQHHMPRELAVTCPACGACATFHFAAAREIERNSDKPYFEASKAFEVRRVFRNGWQSTAIYYFGLGAKGLDNIEDLPDGYSASDWHHRRYSGQGQRGAIVCGSCGLRRKHRLKWPDDAFFQIEFRGRVLWAFDRQSMVSLIAYVEAADRKPQRRRGQETFLIKVPSHFLAAKARDRVARRLRDRLAVSDDRRWSERGGVKQ
ncbi:MAG: hypothetical protein AAFV31_16880 [Pseudomonadota bacterium]